MERTKAIQDEMGKIIRTAKTPSHHLAIKKFCRQPVCYILAITLLAMIGPLFVRFTPADNPHNNHIQDGLPQQPVGKIVSPPHGASTSREVTITCFTKDIAFDRPFVWAIVDVPNIGLCWPKRPIAKPDGNFRINFYEGGPNEDFNVSLYAVGYGMNKTIEKWHRDGIFGGLPIIPPQYKLDSIVLSLNGA